MKVIVREVCNEDWRAIYLNNKKVIENHGIWIEEICEELQKLISKGNVITSISGEHYYLNDVYAEEHGFPDSFSNIPKDVLV